MAEFHNLVQRSFPIEKNKLISIAKRSGKLRLILVSGLFLNRDDSPVDLFVVADNLSERRLESAIKEEIKSTKISTPRIILIVILVIAIGYYLYKKKKTS